MKKPFLLAAIFGFMSLGAYCTQGGTIEFDTTASPVVLSDGVTISYDSGGSQSYDTADQVDNASPIFVDYGTFTASGVSSSDNSITPEPYTIDLSVMLPGVSSRPITGSITGYFYASGMTNNVDTLQFLTTDTYTHTYNTDGIGTITWSFFSTSIGVAGPAPYSGDMLGEISYTTIPLPASVAGGSLLLALLGLGKAIKNRELI